MKSIDSNNRQYSGKAADTPPPGVGRKLLIASLWLASVGFWLWAGVQLGQLIVALWF